MGCCSSLTENVLKSPESYLYSLISSKLSKNSLSLDFTVISSLDFQDINKPILQIHSLKLNALAYAILLADLKLAKYLHETLHASFFQTQNLLESQNSGIIELLIENFNEPMLDYCLPFYAELKQNSVLLDTTLNFDSVFVSQNCKKIHPMRYAVELGCGRFVDYVAKRYGQRGIPEMFDIHAVDEDSGENCALVACRAKHYDLVVKLYKCGADFTVKNKRKEGAILVTLSLFEEGDEIDCLKILVFLVENVKLTMAEDYEEILMLARDPEIVEYIEGSLQEIGIYATKSAVEGKYNTSYSYGSLFSQTIVEPASTSALSQIPVKDDSSGFSFIHLS
jgi:hypothetical protein